MVNLSGLRASDVYLDRKIPVRTGFTVALVTITIITCSLLKELVLEIGWLSNGVPGLLKKAQDDNLAIDEVSRRWDTPDMVKLNEFLICVALAAVLVVLYFH